MTTRTLLLLSLLSLVGVAGADEPKLDLQSSLVGAGLLIAPAPFTGPDLSLGHAWELEGFSYAVTDIGERILPKGYQFMSPIAVGLLDGFYRGGEGFGNDLIRRKFICDLLGILGRVSLDIKF